MQNYPQFKDPIGDAIRGDLSIRQLRVMLEHLPASNPIVWERHGHQWGDVERLLLDLVNSGRVRMIDFKNVHKKKGAKDVEYDLMPTPEEVIKRRAMKSENRSPEQVQAERHHLEAVLDRERPARPEDN